MRFGDSHEQLGNADDTRNITSFGRLSQTYDFLPFHFSEGPGFKSLSPFAKMLLRNM